MNWLVGKSGCWVGLWLGEWMCGLVGRVGWSVCGWFVGWVGWSDGLIVLSFWLVDGLVGLMGL